MPVYLKQIAKVEDGAQSPANYVSFGYGNAVENGKNSNQNILQLRFRFLK